MYNLKCIGFGMCQHICQLSAVYTLNVELVQNETSPDNATHSNEKN